MTSKVIVALGLLLATAAQAQLAVSDKAIVRTGKLLKLDVHYPHTGRAGMDRMFSGLAAAYAAGGEPNRPDPLDLTGEASKGANGGWMGYQVRRNDARMFVVQVSTNTYYAGHAHGMPDMISFNFLMPDGARVELAELVDGPRGLARVNSLAIAGLSRLPRLQGVDPKYIRDGAGDFRNFAWLSDALELTYEPYEIAGYAQGELKVRIPLAELADVIRPDPRAPAPSFACATARTAIEHTICSDAALARLDRRVADDYRGWLAVVPAARADEKPQERQYRQAEQARHDAQLAAQRLWLAARDKDCAGGDKACLILSYRARQAALAKTPR